MTNLSAKDSILLYYPAEKIYRVLTDFATYPAWYPKGIKFSIGYLDKKVIGTTLSIQNSPLVKWEAKIGICEQSKSVFNTREVAYSLCTQFSGGSLLLSKGISPHDTLARLGYLPCLISPL